MYDDIDRSLLQASAALVVASLGGLQARYVVVGPDDLTPEGLGLEFAGTITGSKIYHLDELDSLPCGAFDTVLAIDVLDHAVEPIEATAALRRLLADHATLTILQPNRLLRRGMQPQTAGGPVHTLSYYETRSLFERDRLQLHTALVTLDGNLMVQSHNRDAQTTAPSQAIAFAFCLGTQVSPFTVQKMQPPQGIPVQATDLVLVSPEIALGEVRQIAFVIDVHNWAFDNIVNHIGPSLADRYEVTRFYIEDYEDRSELFLDLFIRNSFDNIHCMWREYLFNTLQNRNMLMTLLKNDKLSAAELATRLAAPVLTTTAYDHLFLTPSEVDERRAALAVIDGYSVASGILKELYSQSFETPPDIETPDGVNIGFYRNTAPRNFSVDRPIRIGWVGNSAWGSSNAGVGEDPKGLHSILMPAIEQLKADGLNVTLALADRNLRKRDREQMRDYYASEIDILVCASAFEGTPNPIMEAMASGCPFVSTDVGIVREVCGPLQADFILPERSIVSMVEMLHKMIAQPDIAQALSEESLTYIVRSDWSARTDSWTQLFANAEKTHGTGRRLLREQIMLSSLNEWSASSILRQGSGQKDYEIKQLWKQLIQSRKAADGHRERIVKLVETTKKLRTEVAARAAILDDMTRDTTSQGTNQNDTSGLGRLRLQYEELVKHYDEMSTLNEALEREIEQIKRTALERDGARLQADRIAELEDWTADMQAELTRKDAWIGQMQARIAELESWSIQMQSTLQDTKLGRFTRSIKTIVKGKS